MANGINVALLLALLPVGGNYYHAFLLLGVGVFLLIRLDYISIRFSNEKLVWIALFGIIPSVLWSVIQMADVAGLRQYIYILLAFLFLAVPGKRFEISHVRWFGLFITGVVVADFMFLYLDLAGIAEKYLMLAVNQSFQDYVGAYYRYLGALGSPNLSGVLYVLFAVNQLIFFRRFGNFLYLLGFALAIYLTIVTFSRTAWVCFLVSLLVTREVRIRSYLMFVLPPMCLLYVLVFSGTDSGDILLSRFSDFSSGQERGAIVQDFFQQLDGLALLLGNPSVPLVLDNDYLLLFFRFGILGFMAWGFLIASAVVRNCLKCGYGVLPFYVVFLMSGLSGGAIGNPQLSFAVLLCIWAYSSLVGATGQGFNRCRDATSSDFKETDGTV